MKVMMKELGEIITGNTPSKKTEEFWNSEDICFIKPDIIADNGINEIVDSNEYISEDARKKARVVGKNSIFITCIGNIGKLGIASDGEYAFNQQINAIIPNDRVQPKYLAYNLLFNKARLVAMANAPVVPIINKSQFGEFTVNIETDIDRQNETVDVLDKLTQIIQQRNKEISALDELIKARFVELFGDVVLNDKHWETQEFSKVTDSRLGKMLDAKRQTGQSSFPYLANANVQWFRFEVDCLNEMDFNEAEQKEFALEEGDLLVCEGGEIGRCAIWHNQVQPCFFQKALHRVRCKQGIILPDYLAWWFKFNCENNGFTAIEGAKATIAHLPGAKLKKLRVVIPPLSLQNQFADFVTQVDKSKAAVQKALDETQLLFDSLMQKYFG